MSPDVGGDPAARPPVLLLAFNRPATTRRVLDAIRGGGVRELYVALDGPRPGNARDAAGCAEVLELVTAADEPWRLHLLRRETNLGGKAGVVTALDWFFDQVPEGIVLEDDCVPAPDLFGFAAAMLERFRDDERVWQVSGSNLMGEWQSQDRDYLFSSGGDIWGWASWRRAWQQRDMDGRLWADPQARATAERFLGPLAWERLAPEFAAAADSAVDDVWDYQWAFTRACHEALTVFPAVNLVANIGFGSHGTHTAYHKYFAEMPFGRLTHPLRPHDEPLVFDHDFQWQVLERARTGQRPPLPMRAVRRLRRVLNEARGHAAG